MALQTTLLEALASLQDCFPRQELRQGTIQAYGAMLADIPAQTLVGAIHRIVARSKFWPSIAEIREAAAEILMPLPTKDEFLAEVETQRRTLRDGKRAELRLQVYQDAIDAVGGWGAVMRGTLDNYDRQQLATAYDAIRKRMQEKAVLGSMAELTTENIAGLLPPPELAWERDIDGTPVPPDRIFVPGPGKAPTATASWMRMPGGALRKIPNLA